MVFDEAHEIEDVAGQYFGVSVSNYRFQELQRDITAVARAKKFGSAELDRILDRFEELATHLFSVLPAPEGRAAFTGRAEFVERNEEVYRHLHSALELIGSHLKLLKSPPVEIIPLQRRAVELGWRCASSSRATISPTSIGRSAAAAASFCKPRPSRSRRCSPSASSIKWKPWC